MNPPAEGAAIASPPVGWGSRITFRDLSMRRDGEDWIVGRVETGDFILVPPIAYRILLLLSGQHTVGEAHAIVHDETAEDVDIVAFVQELTSLGFIEAISGHSLGQAPGPAPSLPWLKPQHARWLLHPLTAFAFVAIIFAAAGYLISYPKLMPAYHSLVWSRYGAAILAGNAVAVWTLILLHELAHLATARAAGVPARFSLGTRLQFLAAQTDVTGVRVQPRRIRLTVYLAGIAANMAVASIGIIVEATAASAPGELLNRILAAVVTLSVLSAVPEFLIFMRTDIYFVLQDLAGCANLYRDGTQYLRYLLRRIWCVVAPGITRPADPSSDLPQRERRIVRLYAVLLVAGTAVCVMVAVSTELPVLVLVLTRAFAGLAGHNSAAGIVNGIAVLAIAGGTQVLWARTWWRRHGQRVKRLLDTPRHMKGGDHHEEDQDPQTRED
jgi:putative peptide zinc metalloprotease protein